MAEVIPAFRQACADPAISGQPLKVYVHLHDRLDVVQYRRVKIFALAELLGMHEGNVARALKTLISRGYLRAKGPRKERVYQLAYSVERDAA